ncbi:hypothetical protein H0H81_002908 [Sphagnurus paluster]|uniref:Uncharacterized protein n=1 Tax=Sphagnurus paluster TaxID=117069 RepID=A0A9P7FT59_9AGAR|nr:hypothetical protein H0H81_002908 [Sphagnurus paluster]
MKRPRFPFRTAWEAPFNSYSADSTVLQEAHAERQRKEKEKYEKRMREFELEMEAEQREIERQEREKQLKAEQRISAQAEAFEYGKFARAGNSLGVRNAVDKYSLDVNAPAKQQKKPQTANFQTLLHLAGSSCDPELVFFLLDRGTLFAE